MNATQRFYGVTQSPRLDSETNCILFHPRVRNMSNCENEVSMNLRRSVTSAGCPATDCTQVTENQNECKSE